MVLVASCRFMRLSCSEDDHPLFRSYYARSNRERGVKLLRCFPHCCPEHVQRCYCGTSVHVQVTFATALPPDSQQRLLVCARFEPSRVVPPWPTNIADTPGFEGEDYTNQENERKLQPGEVVALPASLLLAGKTKSKQTLWIRADREGEAKQKTLPQNATLYVLNNHRYPKWLYSYDSSVTRTQREMTHHLVIYVFQLIGNRSQTGEIDAAVLARHESPGFSLISYRRSGNNARDAGCDLPALDTASSTKFAAVEVDASVLASTSDAREVGLVGQSTPSGTRSDFETKSDPTPAYESAFASTETNNTTTSQSATAGNTDSDAVFWANDARVYHSSIAEKAKHLLILWRFLGYVTLSEAGVTSDTLNAQIRSHWLHGAKALRASPGARTSQLESVMSSFLLSLCRNTHTISSGQPPSREQVVVQAAVHLLLRALSSRAVQYAVQSAFTMEPGGDIDKRQARERFIILVSDLYDILNDLVQLEAPDIASAFLRGRISVPTLVDEVLSLIYSYRQFTGLRKEVLSLLRDQRTSHMSLGTVENLFGAFTNQMQDFIFSVGPDQSERWTDSGNHQLSPWNRRWLLDPGSIQVSSISQDHRLSIEPSLLEFLRYIYEVACIEMVIRDDGSRMSVRSMLPMINGMTQTELLLDGRLRAFRASPSGISAMLSTPGGWSIGDYAATFSGQTNTLEINLYAARDNITGTDNNSRYSGQLENGTIVRRISVTFVLEEQLQAGDLPAAVDPRDRFIFFSGVIAQAMDMDTHAESSWGSQPNLGDMAAASRSVILQELQWISKLEIQGGYVAVQP